MYANISYIQEIFVGCKIRPWWPYENFSLDLGLQTMSNESLELGI
jgi:hypothetical protein